jgi:hypothetical protein
MLRALEKHLKKKMNCPSALSLESFMLDDANTTLAHRSQFTVWRQDSMLTIESL